MRRARHGLFWVALAGLGACAHTPAQRPATPPVQAAVVPAPTAAEAPPPAQPPAMPVAPWTEAPSSPATAEGAAPAVEAVVPPAPAATGDSASPADATAAASAASQTPVTSPAEYPDLFTRMRAGFRLEDGDHKAIDQQLRWYANNPDYLQRAFGRSDLYLYHIVSELEARGMPLELALLPVVESAFEPYAFSRASASGLWQFIPGTGSRYGLRQDWWYDGRRDIVESTRAALDYLQSLHDEFNGDWLLAIAAYNCGEVIVERSVTMNRASGRPIDFWSLWLPRETRAYVPKLLAMRRLVLDPRAYGLEITPVANQPYFTRVATGGQISMKVAAEIAGITPDELYELNPAFHRWATDPVGPYSLLLPVDAAQVFSENIAQLSADQLLGVEQYTVKRGDSVASVAQHFNTTANVLRELNDLPDGHLTVGDDVRVPSDSELPAKVVLAAARVDGRVRGHRPHVLVVRHGDTLYSIARRNRVDVGTLAALNGMQPDDPLRAGQRIKVTSASRSSGHSRAHRHVLYTVRSGDTVAGIAQLFQCSVPQILAWNGLGPNPHIHAGQKLRIHVVRHT